jgi:DNA-binding NarL/FixJ family response regulator
LSKGAAGYLAKKADEVEILTAIKKVLNKEYHIPPHLVDFYIKSNLKHSFGDNMQIPINLSAVEKKIIEYTFCDCNAKEISEKLKLSKRTVDTYRQRLIQKTGAKSMFGVVRYALRHNLIEAK